MAFGFSPNHIQEFSLNNLTPEHFLVIAIESAEKLGWKISYTSETGFIAYTKFSMTSWSEEVTVKIEDKIAILKSECTGSQIMDWGKNKQNIENLVTKIDEIKLSIKQEDFAYKLSELKPNLISIEDDILNKLPLTTKEKIIDFFSILVPTEGYFITPILLNINILVLVIMAFTGVNIMQPDSESLLNWGANFRPLTLNSDPWRLFTNCFLHIGILHLLMNMYALLYIGLLLEPYLGKSRFLSAYILSGIMASLASLWWHDFTISAGASGAIFGMYGVFLAMLTTNLIEKSARQAFLTSIAVFVGFNLINGLKGGIDNAAHIGGLIVGLFIGYAYIPSLKKPNETNLKLSTIGLLTVLILSTSFIVYKKIPNDFGMYDKKIKEFSSMEEMALGFYNLPKETPKDKQLYEIKDRGIYYWQKNLKLIESFKELDLPLEIRARNLALKEYCELRIKSYDLLYKSISIDSINFDKEIEELNKQIEAKLDYLRPDQNEK